MVPVYTVFEQCERSHLTQCFDNVNLIFTFASKLAASIQLQLYVSVPSSDGTSNSAMTIHNGIILLDATNIKY